MVHVSLTITGEIDEVVQIVRCLAPQQPTLALPVVAEPAPTTRPEPVVRPEPTLQLAAPDASVHPAAADAETTAGWTPERAATLMNGITGDAALVVLYLARRTPPEASPEQIRADLQFPPRQLTNALISVGNRASRAGLPTPAIAKLGNTLRLQNDLAQAVSAPETANSGAPQSHRNAEWFDISG